MKWLPANLKGIMGIVTILLVFGYLFGITFFEIKADKEIVMTTIVAIVAFGKDIYNYFFGNSQGSNKKDEIIANLNATPIVSADNADVLITNKEVKDEIDS